jgi:hypothetical protein
MTEHRARLLIGIALSSFACGEEDSTPTPMGPIELVGTWHSSFGGDEVITATQWGTATIVVHDNQANSAVLQNADDDLFFPSKFSKVVWVEPNGGRFSYCTVDFDLDTKEAALASPRTADPSQLETSGCGGFPWTGLGPTFELSGSYESTFGTMEDITSDVWAISGAGYETEQQVIEFNNQDNVAVLQNPADDAFNPSKFAKVVWTEKSAGSFHYCIIDFGKDTAAQARTSTKTADAAALDTNGCGGFSWTKLEPRSAG